LISEVNQIHKNKIISKLYTDADNNTQKTLKEIRSLISSAGDNFSDEIKYKLSYYRELSKIQFTLVGDFIGLYKELLEYIKIKISLHEKDDKSLTIPDHGKITYWSILDKDNNFRGRLLGTNHFVKIDKNLTMKFLHDIDITLAELDVYGYHYETGIKIDSDLKSSTVGIDVSIMKFSKVLKHLDNPGDQGKILSKFKDLNIDEKEAQIFAEKLTGFYLKGDIKNIKKLLKENIPKDEKEKELNIELFTRDHNWHEKILNTFKDNPNKAVLIAVGLGHVIREKLIKDDIDLKTLLEKNGFTLKEVKMSF